MTLDDLRARRGYEEDRIGLNPAIYIDPAAESSHVLVAEYDHAGDRHLRCVVGRSWAFAEQALVLQADALGLRMPAEPFPYPPTWVGALEAEDRFQQHHAEEKSPSRDPVGAWLRYELMQLRPDGTNREHWAWQMSDLLLELSIEAEPSSLRTLRAPQTKPEPVVQQHIRALVKALLSGVCRTKLSPQGYHVEYQTRVISAAA